MPTVLVPLLEGFEEIEAVAIIDVLRRADVEVVIASDSAGPVRGSHGIEIVADAAIDDVDPGSLDMIALPGGLPGATHLKESASVQSLLKTLAGAGKFTGAICAAPVALAAAGVIDGKRVTCHPSVRPHLPSGDYVADRVVVDGQVVTSSGPGTALEFALELVRLLCGPEADARLAEMMLVQR